MPSFVLYLFNIDLSHSISQYLHTVVTHKDKHSEPPNDRDFAPVISGSAHM